MSEHADVTPQQARLLIQSMDLDAQGIAHREDGKVVFVEGAVPFERVTVKVHRRKSNWEQGSVLQILQPSSQRVNAKCDHFGMHAGACGGCKMQHLNVSSQLAVKQRVLEDNLWHIGKVKPDIVLRPMQGPDWAYRYRARLSVRYVVKKSKVLIGFHERKSTFIADMSHCEVLPSHVSDLLLPLRALIFSLSVRDQCPQIEVACGDTHTALILRHLAPLADADRQKLLEFSKQHHILWWLQPKGPDSISPLGHADVDADGSDLHYALPDFHLKMYFRPTDFTQVNPFINRTLVSQAIRWLDIKPDDVLMDWFCGLGNFTLPMATLAKRVMGVEGSPSLLNWADRNLRRNNASRQALGLPQLSDVAFTSQNLFEIDAVTLQHYGQFAKWLIDPPREGAFALVKALAEAVNPDSPAKDWRPPSRIVYISCNPATLARDAGLLVNVAGYKCSAAGIVNMFPHTAHVESIAVFDLP